MIYVIKKFKGFWVTLGLDNVVKHMLHAILITGTKIIV